MGDKDKDSLCKARAYAFLLLKFRPRSEREIYLRLRKKKFDPEIIAKTLSFLKSREFIDDREFTRLWVSARLKRPFGMRRIKDELKLKGIDSEIIDAQIGKIRQGYCEEDTVSKLAADKFKRMEGIDSIKAKRRVYGYLLRRGFSPDVIMEVLNKS